MAAHDPRVDVGDSWRGETWTDSLLRGASMCCCGHRQGRHQAVANAMRVTAGVCTARGCECRAFQDVRWADPNLSERAA